MPQLNSWILRTIKYYITVLKFLKVEPHFLLVLTDVIKLLMSRINKKTYIERFLSFYLVQQNKWKLTTLDEIIPLKITISSKTSHFSLYFKIIIMCLYLFQDIKNNQLIIQSINGDQPVSIYRLSHFNNKQ